MYVVLASLGIQVCSSLYLPLSLERYFKKKVSKSKSFGGLMDGSALLAMLLGWCVGGGLFGVVWFGRLGEVGW